jgi:multicomponent Na+:H+ antiporter subunit D
MALLLILLPLIWLLILNLPFRGLMRRVLFISTFLLSALQIIVVSIPKLNFFNGDPTGISSLFNISLAVDPLTKVLLLSIGIVSMSTLLVSRVLIKDIDRRFNFVSMLVVAMIGMNGVVLVKDLFSMYVFIEVVSIASFVMIAFNRDLPSLEGSFKYIIFSAVATIIMLCALAMLLLFTTDTSFSAIATALKASNTNHIMVFALAFYLIGMFIKSGLMPFHGWLPDAYSTAPAATSLLLAGIITKASGVYPLIRIMHSVFGYSTDMKAIILLVGAFTIVIAAFAAITQTNFKRMLAYSSISQVGYIVLSLGTGTALGIAAAIFHLFNHAIFKSLLFVNSAAVESRTGTNDIDKMGGLAQKMPVTGITSALASLSVSGIPPLSGFWSKLLIIIALWKSNNQTYAVIAVLASLVTLAYMLTLQRKVFFGKLEKGFENVTEAETPIVVASIFLAAILIAVSVLFPFLIGTFLIPVGGF